MQMLEKLASELSTDVGLYLAWQSTDRLGLIRDRAGKLAALAQDMMADNEKF